MKKGLYTQHESYPEERVAWTDITFCLCDTDNDEQPSREAMDVIRILFELYKTNINRIKKEEGKRENKYYINAAPSIMVIEQYAGIENAFDYASALINKISSIDSYEKLVSFGKEAYSLEDGEAYNEFCVLARDISVYLPEVSQLLLEFKDVMHSEGGHIHTEYREK